MLLITSLSSRRWILPKGWIDPAMTPAEAAAREAFEEAGITGKTAAKPLGSYHYLKARKDGSGIPCSVTVFALEVTGQTDNWPEKGAREILWLPLEEAAAKVSEPGLRDLLRGFRQRPRIATRRAG